MCCCFFGFDLCVVGVVVVVNSLIVNLVSSSSCDFLSMSCSRVEKFLFSSPCNFLLHICCLLLY